MQPALGVHVARFQFGSDKAYISLHAQNPSREAHVNLLKTFEVMSGSTTGSAHRLSIPLTPNQDRVLTVVNEDLIVCCFSDGCSSSEFSQIGADLTVQTLKKAIQARYKSGKPFNRTWFKRLYWHLVETLWASTNAYLAVEDHDNREKMLDVIMSHMLATAGGCVIDNETVWRFGVPEVFGLLNGDQFVWPAKVKDEAPYPALAYHNEGFPFFGDFIVEDTPVTDLNTLMMGPDGVGRLLKVCANPKLYIPGTRVSVGRINQVFTRDEFYTDPNACSEWLNALAAGSEDGEEPGFLGDDTTLFGVRRLKES
jgi:hypothetical protein